MRKRCKEIFLVGIITLVAMSGCKSAGKTYDLNSLEGKAQAGMSEVQVVNALGTPSKITVEGETRELRYDGNDGKGFIVVSLRGNIVINARRR